MRRRAEIGVLRAVGAARSTILGLFLAEAALFGVVGAAIGVALGRLLAAGMVGLIAGTVNALYTTSRPAAITLTAGEVWIGILTGTLVALGSGFAPAREAMQAAPTQSDEPRRARASRHAAVEARLVRGAGAGSARGGGIAVGRDRRISDRGYAAALLSIGAAALIAPALVLAVNRVTRSLTGRRAESLLAGRSLTGSLSRTSV